MHDIAEKEDGAGAWKHKFEAGAGKHKERARAGKNKLGTELEGRGPGNTNTPNFKNFRDKPLLH